MQKSKVLTTEILKRYEQFWNHQDTDRPILSLYVHNKNTNWSAFTPSSPRDLWENLEARHARLSYSTKNVKCYGEAMPSDFVNFGPGCLAAMIGSDYLPMPNTIWFGEEITLLEDWANLKEVYLREDSPMYKLSTNLTKLFLEKNDGSYLVGITDLGGSLDILASLRGTMSLLTDLHDNPELALKAVEIIDEIWIEVYKKLRKMIASYQHGHTTWLGPWCETSYYPLQCDFGAMISPDDFEKFVMPSMRRTTDFLDQSIFHLDGPGMIAHLDQLLSLERMDGIQWVPGAGSDPVTDERWFPMYEKIQAAGKLLVLHCDGSGVDKILNICKNFSPKGLWLTAHFDSEEEAEEIIAKA